MYRVGQRVKIIGPKNRNDWGYSALTDLGKIGIVVQSDEVFTRVFIPKSVHPNQFSYRGQHFTWQIYNNELSSLKNEQLLFPFMYDE